MRPRLIAVDDEIAAREAELAARASMRPRLIAVDDLALPLPDAAEPRLQ